MAFLEHASPTQADRIGAVLIATALIAAAAACGRRSAVVSGDAAATVGPPDAAVVATATSRPLPNTAPAVPAPTESATAARDAASSTCKVVGGPAAQPFFGPATLRIAPRPEGDVAELVYNEGGSPRVYDARIAEAKPRAPLPQKSTIPPCAVAGDIFYCPDASGAIHKSRGVGEADTIVARSHPGTDVVAASLGGRPLVAYIADRLTREGLVREGWAALDGAAPVRLSEDGSGTTSIDLAPRGDALIALLVDARVAMTPAHARLLTLEANAIHVGTDAVVFVGGAGERHNAGTLATSNDGAAFALIPVAEDTLRFGMAAITIDDPPIVDSKVVWSFYPNGLDPAPVAATRGESPMHVARARPKTPEPDSAHVLEIGTLGPDATFRPSCVVTEAPFVKDVEIARDRQKTLWVFYRTPSGSFLARVAAT